MSLGAVNFSKLGADNILKLNISEEKTKISKTFEIPVPGALEIMIKRRQYSTS